MTRSLVLTVVLIICAHLPVAWAEEVINAYDVTIEVGKDGDIRVNERIDVTVEGRDIRRGIYRALPLFYTGQDDVRYKYNYKVKYVFRNDRREEFAESSDNYWKYIRAGQEDVLLKHGRHVYSITYDVKNQVRYFPEHDEIYWNATGNGWNFPIHKASVTVKTPEGARVVEAVAYTGGYGQAGADYTHSSVDGVTQFVTTRPLNQREGITVSVSLAKGVIEPPSAEDLQALWWQRNGAISILGIALAALTGFYTFSWWRVGRDPAKKAVYPIYEPPTDLSPAGAHHVYFRRFKGYDALIGSLMNMAVKGHINISVEDKETKITKKRPKDPPALSAEEDELKRDILHGNRPMTIGKKYNSMFSSAYSAYKSRVEKAYGKEYFRWNGLYAGVATTASFVFIIVGMLQVVNWSTTHLFLILAFFGVNGLFLYLMPAATKKGTEVRSQIAGFRLYLETAEKNRLDMMDVTGTKPPVMSKDRYETFLPWAVALGVEKPWTEHFEKVLPDEARDYNPTWSRMATGSHRSLSDMNKSFVSSMAAGAAAASVQPSSSSGSGGGGFSGGGGGGGGGGGW